MAGGKVQKVDYTSGDRGEVIVKLDGVVPMYRND